MTDRYDVTKIEPPPWILGGSNGRGITTPSGYIGDGLIADFDTKAHAEFAIKCVNENAELRAALLTIYDDIPSRPDLTEAGRVALMADVAGKAIGYPSAGLTD